MYTPLYDDNYDILLSLNYTSCLLKHTITVRLLSLPESYYRYLKALNCMDDDDYDEALMEPDSLPSNSSLGLLCQACCLEYSPSGRDLATLSKFCSQVSERKKH